MQWLRNDVTIGLFRNRANKQAYIESQKSNLHLATLY